MLLLNAMSLWSEDYKWHFDYIRLATDIGFSFGKCQQQNLNKTKIALIDIDTVIKNREVDIVEKCIPTVTQFVLDPEQTELLENNFVKIFRLSQLCVEYLLFCKKYLDNTVVLLKEECRKLKEEKSELEKFSEELQLHVSTLIKEIHQKTIVSFQCDECNKMFSTEEYLNAHIKRRHTSLTQKAIIAPNVQEVDIEQLQLEIKDLKGRLNSTEQLIKEQDILKNETTVNNNSKVDDLQQKFESLRVDVESELKRLHKVNNLEEKYEKWFEMTLRNLDELRTSIKTNREEKKEKREIMTQTEQLINDENKGRFKEKINEILQVSSPIRDREESENFFGQNSLEEQSMKEAVSRKNIKSSISQNTKIMKPPVIKPRTKFSLKHSTETEDTNLKEELNYNKTVESPELPIYVRQRPRWIKPDLGTSQSPILTMAEENLEIELSDSEDLEENSELSIKSKVSSQSNFEEIHLDTPSPQKSPEDNLISNQLLNDFEKDIENIVNDRLQDLGISPEWKGLPTKSFIQALRIVEHQTNLLKKTHANYDQISNDIERQIDRKVNESKNNRKYRESKTRRDSRRTSNFKNRTSLNKLKSTSIPISQIEIKNRILFETDSEPENGGKTNEVLPKYKAVIAELKKVSSIRGTGTDRSESPEHNDLTKGVLKNYASTSSLVKKKVNFDLKSNEATVGKKKEVFKDSGSTTSIPSSVFDDNIEEIRRKRNDENIQELEEVSDFDISD